MQRSRWHVTHAEQLHAMMNAKYIGKHNLADRKMLRPVVEDSLGTCCMLADDGLEAELGGLGALVSRPPCDC